jgi:uncharacterized membrane protein
MSKVEIHVRREAMKILSIVKLIHVIFVILWLGTLFCILQLMRLSKKAPPVEVDKIASLCRTLYARFDLSFCIGAIASGLLLLFFQENWNYKAGWFHMKMTGVIGLLIIDFLVGRKIRYSISEKKPFVHLAGLIISFCLIVLFTFSSIYLMRNKEKEWEERFWKQYNELQHHKTYALCEREHIAQA